MSLGSLKNGFVDSFKQLNFGHKNWPLPTKYGQAYIIDI